MQLYCKAQLGNTLHKCT